MCLCSTVIFTELFWCLCRWCCAPDANLHNVSSIWRQNS